MNKVLLDTYTSIKPELTQIQAEIETQLSQLISKAQIKIHSLNGRVKDAESLGKKLARPDRDYKALDRVTDLLAFRIVTYSEDVIPLVARVIENGFSVDFAHSVNKLESEDADRFGYRSLHYVCAMPSTSPVARYKFEVQIRTILQHTWAEIEHDIGYKASEQLPREFRRRFSQIASLLEVADREFVSIRTDLKNYETRLKSNDLAKEALEIDRLTLASLVERPEVRALDQCVAKFLNVGIKEGAFYPDYILRVLRAANLSRVSEILKAAESSIHKCDRFLPSYFEFAEAHLGLSRDSITEVQKGYGLLFLAHIHILNLDELLINKVETVARFYRQIDEIDDIGKTKALAQGLVETLR